MSLTNLEQAAQLLKTKKNILITFRKDGAGDAIACASALLSFLEGRNKMADAVCTDFTLAENLRFLKNADKIKNEFAHLQKFVISLDVEKTGVQELSYDVLDKRLRIFVTPKQGYLQRDNIRTAQSDFRYDLIFVLNSPDLAALGAIFDNNTDLFYKTPIINIDNQPGNEHFGQINFVDLTCASTAEVLFDVLRKMGEENIDEPVATALLSGIISETKSFKADNVRPDTLANASKLIGLGADREKIVRHLYRTRTIAMLKLWGNALANMQIDKKLGLVWSIITREDFIRCGAREADLRDIIDELINTSPEANLTLLLHEHTAPHKPQAVHVMINSKKNLDLKTHLADYKPNGLKNNFSFIVENKSLKEAEEEIVLKLKNILGVQDTNTS